MGTPQCRHSNNKLAKGDKVGQGDPRNPSENKGGRRQGGHTRHRSNRRSGGTADERAASGLVPFITGYRSKGTESKGMTFRIIIIVVITLSLEEVGGGGG